MVDKINGRPLEDVWVERDISFLQVTPGTAADFDPYVDENTQGGFGPDGLVDKVIRILQTRGTVIGISREATTNVLHLMLGHAAGAFEEDPKGLNAVTQLQTQLTQLASDEGAGSLTLAVGSKFSTIV